MGNNSWMDNLCLWYFSILLAGECSLAKYRGDTL